MQEYARRFLIRSMVGADGLRGDVCAAVSRVPSCHPRGARWLVRSCRLVSRHRCESVIYNRPTGAWDTRGQPASRSARATRLVSSLAALAFLHSFGAYRVYG